MYDSGHRHVGLGVSPKPRVAIYARYSSDLQRPTSIDDQVRQCRVIAERNGWEVIDQYSRADSEVSGQKSRWPRGTSRTCGICENLTSPVRRHLD